MAGLAIDVRNGILRVGLGKRLTTRIVAFAAQLLLGEDELIIMFRGVRVMAGTAPLFERRVDLFSPEGILFVARKADLIHFRL